MGYSKEHIEETKQRIMDHAGSLFRCFGYNGIGIDKIMNSAGLTRGGFYAHFSSKAQLFEEVVGADFDFTRQLRKLKDNAGDRTESRALLAVKYYLGLKTREKVARACTMASSAFDVANAGTETKKNFESGLEDLVSEMTSLLADDGKQIERDEVVAILATSVGALILSRACTDRGAEYVLDACNSAIAKQMN